MNNNIPVLIAGTRVKRTLSNMEGCDVSFVQYPTEAERAVMSKEEAEDKAISLFQKVVKCETFVLVLTTAPEMFAFTLFGAALMLNKRTVVIGNIDIDYDLLLFYPTIEVYPSEKAFLQKEKVKVNG